MLIESTKIIKKTELISKLNYNGLLTKMVLFCSTGPRFTPADGPLYGNSHRNESTDNSKGSAGALQGIRP
jgi:hypothetical protein